MSGNGYTWKGMEKVPFQKVIEDFKNGIISFSYWLYPDDTEALIEEDKVTLKKIVDHYYYGGEFGNEKENWKEESEG